MRQRQFYIVLVKPVVWALNLLASCTKTYPGLLAISTKVYIGRATTYPVGLRFKKLGLFSARRFY